MTSLLDKDRAGPPARLELHIDLRHGDLLDGAENTDPSKLTRVLQIASGHMADLLTGVRPDDYNAAVVGSDGNPLAYWVVHTRDAQLVAPTNTEGN